MGESQPKSIETLFTATQKREERERGKTERDMQKAYPCSSTPNRPCIHPHHIHLHPIRPILSTIDWNRVVPSLCCFDCFSLHAFCAMPSEPKDEYFRATNKSRPFSFLIHTMHVLGKLTKQDSTGILRGFTSKRWHAKEKTTWYGMCLFFCRPVIARKCGSAVSPGHLIGRRHSWPRIRGRQWRIKVWRLASAF